MGVPVTRLAHAGDKAGIWHLYQAAMKPHIESIWGWDQDWQSADFDQAFSSSASYVVEVGGEFAGYFQLDLKPGDIYLRMLVLAPAFRSKGLGARLLANLCHMSVQSRRRLSLRVCRVNGEAKRFYEREGWTVESEDDLFWMMTHAGCKGRE